MVKVLLAGRADVPEQLLSVPSIRIADISDHALMFERPTARIAQPAMCDLTVSADDELIEYRTAIHAAWPVRTVTAEVGRKIAPERADIFRAVPDVEQRRVVIECVALDQAALKRAGIDLHVFGNVK